MKKTMSNITKPSLQRMSRQAGVKTMADDCVNTIRDLLYTETYNLCKNVTTVNNHTGTKTIMPADLYTALRVNGVVLAEGSPNDTTRTA